MPGAIRSAFHCRQYWDRNVLAWGQNSKYKRTIQNSRRSNVPSFHCTPGNTQYQAYQSTIQNAIDHSHETCFEAAYISDNDDSTSPNQILPSTLEGEEELSTFTPTTTESPTTTEPPNTEPINDIFMTNPDSLVPRETAAIVEEEEHEVLTTLTDKAELMRWHYRLGHLSFKKLKLLAESGRIPRKLAKLRAPKCACCLYGSMTKKLC
jgi:hypothetical protein